ncbi:MAG: Uma2 family endonuclease, partial [Bacteroidota bacterium]
MSVEITKRLINVEEYHKMAEVGILKPTDRVELIHGEILKISPIGSKHAGIVDRLADFLTDLLRKKYTIKIQVPILLESFAKLDFWFKSRLSEFQKRSLLGVNEAFEILSNEELGQKAGFSKDS